MDRTDHRIDCISNPHSPRSNILHGHLNQGRQPMWLPSLISNKTSQSSCPHVRLRCFAITLLLYVLYGHHRQVIALLSIAHKLVNGLCHQTDKLLRLLLLLGESFYGHIVDAFHIKQLKVGTRRLGRRVWGSSQATYPSVCRWQYGGRSLSRLSRQWSPSALRCILIL